MCEQPTCAFQKPCDTSSVNSNHHHGIEPGAEMSASSADWMCNLREESWPSLGRPHEHSSDDPPMKKPRLFPWSEIHEMEFYIKQIYTEHDQMKCDIFAQSFPKVSCMVIPLPLDLHREVIKQGFMRQLQMSLFGNHRIQKTESDTDILWITVESAILGKNTPHGDDLRVFPLLREVSEDGLMHYVS